MGSRQEFFAKLNRRNYLLVLRQIAGPNYSENDKRFLEALVLMPESRAMQLMDDLRWMICGLDDPFEEDEVSA